MKFLINIILIVGIVVGVLYFFFRDTPFVAAFMPQQIGNVKADESLRKVFLRRVRIAISDQAPTETASLLDYYREAVHNKFTSLAGGGSSISQNVYLAAKRQEFDAYVRAAYDKNNSNAVEAAEWPASERVNLSVLDVNRDSSLTYDEFWAREQKKSLGVFIKADRSGDGNLSEEEYYAAQGGEEAAKSYAISLDRNRNLAISIEEARLGREDAARHWQP